jgi:hypothetical protein
MPTEHKKKWTSGGCRRGLREIEVCSFRAAQADTADDRRGGSRRAR